MGTMVRVNSPNRQNCCDNHSPSNSVVHKGHNFPCCTIITQIARRMARCRCRRSSTPKGVIPLGSGYMSLSGTRGVTLGVLWGGRDSDRGIGWSGAMLDEGRIAGRRLVSLPLVTGVGGRGGVGMLPLVRG